MAEYSIGIDVGGTFTDVTIVEMGSGQTWLTKVESTPADPSVGFINGLRQGAELAGVPAEAVGRIVHGTTVATNAVLERKPTRVALLTTAGFKSVLEIGRHDVPPGENYYGWVKPTRPVTPDLIFEVRERTITTGSVLTPLDEEPSGRIAGGYARWISNRSRSACSRLPAPGARAAGGRDRPGGVPGPLVSVSSVVMPQFREFERSMATVLNAYVTPHVGRYLAMLERRLDGDGPHPSPPRASMRPYPRGEGAQRQSRAALHHEVERRRHQAPDAARQAIQTALSGRPAAWSAPPAPPPRPASPI